MDIQAKKMIDVHQVDCVLEVKIREYRPDIAWYLQRPGKWGFTQGETDNITAYLEYLGLMNRGSLTSEGKNVKESKNVMLPEAGLYQISFTRDTTFGNQVVDLRRISPKDILEGNKQDLEDFKQFQDKTFQSFNEKNKDFIEFSLRFRHRRNDTPKVIHSGMQEAELKVIFENGEAILKFKINSHPYIKGERKLEGFDAGLNLSRWLSGWDNSTSSLELSFKDVKDSMGILKSFQKQINLEGQSLVTSSGEDKGSWNVSLNVTVVPRKESDAKKWMERLLVDRLNRKPMYLSSEKLKELHDEILDETPILKKHSKYGLKGEELLEIFSKHEDRTLYNMVKAADDLLPQGWG